jgi:DNA-binding XRE family transcriptional regulator
MDSADLRAWRARRRWSQEQAADALGYSRRGYQEAEKRDGSVSPKLSAAIVALAERERA